MNCWPSSQVLWKCNVIYNYNKLCAKADPPTLPSHTTPHFSPNTTSCILFLSCMWLYTLVSPPHRSPLDHMCPGQCLINYGQKVLNIGFLSHYPFLKALFRSFWHHHCLQFLYPTNFLVRERFSLLLNTACQTMSRDPLPTALGNCAHMTLPCHM